MAARNLGLLLILCTAVKVHEGLICPDYEMAEWRLKVKKYKCGDGMKYHCAKDDDGIFVEGCATKMKCDKGEEPWFVEKNKVQCRSCTDRERYQLVPRWSYEISQCERERYQCQYAIHQILCDDGNTKSPRTCGCDYSNDYVPIAEKDKGCRESNDLHCVLDSPRCKEDEERLQSNYSCVLKCKSNRDRITDRCIDSGPVPTTLTTPPSTKTSTTSTTTEQSKTTTAPPDDNGRSNILTSIMAVVIVAVLIIGVIIVGTISLIRVKIKLKHVEGSPNSVWSKIFVQPLNLFKILMCANFLWFIGSLVCLLVMKLIASRRNNKDIDMEEDPEASTALQEDTEAGAGTSSHQADGEVCSCFCKQTHDLKLSTNEIGVLVILSSVSGGIGILVMMFIKWNEIHVIEAGSDQVDTEEAGSDQVDTEANVSSVFAEMGRAVMKFVWRKKFKEKATEQPSTERPTDVEPSTDTSAVSAITSSMHYGGHGTTVIAGNVIIGTVHNYGETGNSSTNRTAPGSATEQPSTERPTDVEPSTDTSGTPSTSNVDLRIQLLEPEISNATLTRSSPQHPSTDPQPGSDVQVQDSSVPVQDSTSCLTDELQSKCPTENDLLTISKHIGNKYVQLGIRLGLSMPEIEAIEIENPLVDNRIFKILYTWKKKNAVHATFGHLENAILDIRLVSAIVFKDIKISDYN